MKFDEILQNVVQKKNISEAKTYSPELDIDPDEIIEDLESNVDDFVRNLNMTPAGMKNTVSKLVSRVFKTGGNKRVESVFKKMKSPSSTSVDVRFAMLLLTLYLRAVIEKYGAATAGFLFESYISGLLGDQKYVLPLGNPAEDIAKKDKELPEEIPIAKKKGSTNNFTLKLHKPTGMAATSRRNVIQYVDTHGGVDDLEPIKAIVGLKHDGTADKISIFMYDATQDFIDAYVSNKTVRISKNPTEVDLDFHYDISLDKTLSYLLKSEMHSVALLMKNAGKFLNASLNFFTGYRRSQTKGAGLPELMNANADLTKSYTNVIKKVSKQKKLEG